MYYTSRNTLNINWECFFKEIKLNKNKKRHLLKGNEQSVSMQIWMQFFKAAIFVNVFVQHRFCQVSLQVYKQFLIRLCNQRSTTLELTSENYILTVYRFLIYNYTYVYNSMIRWPTTELTLWTERLRKHNKRNLQIGGSDVNLMYYVIRKLNYVTVKDILIKSSAL